MSSRYKRPRSSDSYRLALLWVRTILIGIYKHRHNCSWALATLSFLLMLAWNPKLILSTGVGVGLMLLIYRLQDWDWSKVKLSIGQIIKSSNGRLSVAVGGGGLGALTTYTAAEIWAEVDNSWLAFSSIVQGIATLGSLGLLMWYVWGQQERTKKQDFERWLDDLTAQESLKRLIAIRRLTELIDRASLSPVNEIHVREFFGIMLTREKDATVRSALLEALQISPVAGPLQLPIKQAISKKRVYQ